jgi:glycosyltransferase involved in cell wall biosynthesis
MTYGDRVICVSHAIKEYIQQNYRVPDEKIVVIPRGVDLALFDPDNIDQTFIHDITVEFSLREKYVVSSVGRITQLKDYETFIRGIVAARKEIPNICGLIVGGVRSDKQSYFDSLKKLVAEFDASSFVHFVGSQTKIAEIYAISDLVAVCSKKPESFGRTAAEALAMNVPVVASAHGGVLDIVVPGETGYLFVPEDVTSLADAIISNKEENWQGLRQFVERNFTLEQMSAATFNVYRELVCCPPICRTEL